jgi:hypothetical protein
MESAFDLAIGVGSGVRVSVVVDVGSGTSVLGWGSAVVPGGSYVKGGSELPVLDGVSVLSAPLDVATTEVCKVLGSVAVEALDAEDVPEGLAQAPSWRLMRSSYPRSSSSLAPAAFLASMNRFQGPAAESII